MELKVCFLGLLPQRQNFRLERCPRPKQIYHHPNNEPDKISHPATASPDSRSTASQIEFATGTTTDQNLDVQESALRAAGCEAIRSEKRSGKDKPDFYPLRAPAKGKPRREPSSSQESFEESLEERIEHRLDEARRERGEL
jgi:hypothetical protein